MANSFQRDAIQTSYLISLSEEQFDAILKQDNVNRAIGHRGLFMILEDTIIAQDIYYDGMSGCYIHLTLTPLNDTEEIWNTIYQVIGDYINGGKELM